MPSFNRATRQRQQASSSITEDWRSGDPRTPAICARRQEYHGKLDGVVLDIGRGSKAAVVEEMPAGGDGAFQRGSGRRRHEHGSTPRSGALVFSRHCGLVEPKRSGEDGRAAEIDELYRHPSMAAAASTGDAGEGERPSGEAKWWRRLRARPQACFYRAETGAGDLG